MSFKNKFLGGMASLLLLVSCGSRPNPENVWNIIPEPVSVRVEKGSFTFGPKVGVSVVDSTLLPAIHYLDEVLPVDVQLAVGDAAEMIITYDNKMKAGAYHLEINKKGIVINGADYDGVASAISTLRQLLPAQLTSKNLSVSAVTVDDAPRFGWRGMHLDVSRHFYNKEEVMQVLDKMALYKFNKFHWHLTDDQGWRIEIKRYPLLTEKGAFRELNWQDRDCLKREQDQHNPDFRLQEDKLKTVEGKQIYGGYYTQEEIREVVAYAAVRGIDVIPEIDMPGHFLAAIDQYPYVTCKGQKGWGTLFSSPVCVGNDEAVDFCKNIWKEVFQLFPYEYAHIGGDEVDKSNWKRCRDCRNRVRKEGLKDADALQAWFIREMEKFFKENGKKMMGWDEVLEDGLSQDAVISWWRNWVPDAVQRATAKGMKTVICPGSYMYFDAQQSADYVSKIYEWEPMPQDMTPEQQALVLGVQCNVWTEWIPTVDRMEYMIFPRLLSASEVAWRSAEKEKDYASFEKKVKHHIARMDEMGINYRIPDLYGFFERSVFVDKDVLDVKCPLEGIEIHYTTDGSVPTLDSPLYTRPIEVEETMQFALRAFRPDGTGDQIFHVSFNKEDYLPAQEMEGKLLLNGLKADWYDFRGNACEKITTAPFNKTVIAKKIEIPEEVKGNIGLILKGYIQIPEDGIYTFVLYSDDGSRLIIDGQDVIDNDGPHGPIARVGQKALRAGLHQIEVPYFDFNGGTLKLFYKDENGEDIECPESWFKYVGNSSENR